VRKKGKETKKADEVLEGVLSQNVVRSLSAFVSACSCCVCGSFSFSSCWKPGRFLCVEVLVMLSCKGALVGEV
jgi:hypothetical protein